MQNEITDQTPQTQHPFSESFLKRFWVRIDKNGVPPNHVKHLGACWLWTWPTNKGYGNGGYAIIGLGGKKGRVMLSHRASWIIHNGPIPEGLCVCHKCDVRNCVNPSHLFLGTREENNKDCWSKDRFPRGERNCCAKLTNNDVKNILRFFAKGLTNAEISRMFGVSWPTIGKIREGKRWVRTIAHLISS